MIRLHLCFFGGGGGGSEQVRVRDPEPQELIDLRAQINKMLSPLMGEGKPPGWNSSDFGQSYNDTKERVDSAMGYYDDISRQLFNVTTKGEIPSAVTDNMNHSVDRSLNKSIGSSLNDLAGRGVLNSSVTNKSLDSLSDSAADAYSKNYLSAYDSITGALSNSRNSYLEDPSKLWIGSQSQFAPAYNFWKDWQTSYNSKEDYDTVVHQGK